MMTNCIVTEIRSAGTLDSYAQPTADGTTLWEGRAAGYIKRQRRNTRAQDAEADVTLDALYLQSAPVSLEPGATWAGHIVVVEDHRTGGVPVTVTYRVRAAEHRAVGTIADSWRVELETV